jgi:hypothetical protein
MHCGKGDLLVLLYGHPARLPSNCGDFHRIPYLVVGLEIQGQLWASTSLFLV